MPDGGLSLIDRIIVTGALVAAAIAVVLVAKQRRRSAAVPPAAATVRSTGPMLYLFLDGRDHDADCERVYAAFDAARKRLPRGVAAERVDVDHGTSLAKRFGVRVLPTVLLTGPSGAVVGRVEGEGDEAVSRVLNLVSRIPKRS